MADVFSRLVDRVQGSAPVARPVLDSMFAPSRLHAGTTFVAPVPVQADPGAFDPVVEDRSQFELPSTEPKYHSATEPAEPRPTVAQEDRRTDLRLNVPVVTQPSSEAASGTAIDSHAPRAADAPGRLLPDAVDSHRAAGLAAVPADSPDATAETAVVDGEIGGMMREAEAVQSDIDTMRPAAIAHTSTHQAAPAADEERGAVTHSLLPEQGALPRPETDATSDVAMQMTGEAEQPDSPATADSSVPEEIAGREPSMGRPDKTGATPPDRTLVPGKPTTTRAPWWSSPPRSSSESSEEAGESGTGSGRPGSSGPEGIAGWRNDREQPRGHDGNDAVTGRNLLPQQPVQASRNISQSDTFSADDDSPMQDDAETSRAPESAGARMTERGGKASRRSELPPAADVSRRDEPARAVDARRGGEPPTREVSRREESPRIEPRPVVADRRNTPGPSEQRARGLVEERRSTPVEQRRELVAQRTAQASRTDTREPARSAPELVTQTAKTVQQIVRAMTPPMTPRASSPPSRGETQRDPSPAPIRVTIGKIEVKAQKPAASSNPSAQPAQPRSSHTMTLDTYMKQRNGRSQ